MKFAGALCGLLSFLFWEFLGWIRLGLIFNGRCKIVW